MRLATVLVLLFACGDASEDQQTDLAATLTTRSVTSFVPDGITSMELAALDEQRLAVARVEHVEGAFCPDCVGLDPSECPSVCERSLVSATTVSLATGELGTPRPVATVFPRSFDDSVGQVHVVALGGERVGIAWLDCDNASCGGLAARRSCTAQYTTLDLATGTVGTPVTLYTGWFGDLSLGFDQPSRRLVAVLGKDLVFGQGVWRAIFDEHGARLADWKALGSAAARSPAIVGLTVIADDWSPAAPPRNAPCAVSCECLDGGTIDLARGGLFAFDEAGTATQIANGRDPRGFYGRREQIAAIDAGGRTIVATTQSIDRSAELFAFDGTWHPLLSTPAPIPTWIGVLGTSDRAAWLGAQPQGDQATIQRLVAGIFAGETSTLATLDDPLDRSILVVEPVPATDGVTTNVLLQGIFERTGGMLRWARFELLAVEASWSAP
jgi:hypothetical protein